jgi:FkbM family methyltransferase
MAASSPAGVRGHEREELVPGRLTPGNLLGWAAAWYLRAFPLQRGKGLLNRLLGSFLRVEVFRGVKVRILNPLEFHQRALLRGEPPLEPEVVDLVWRCLRPGSVFFDVGANLGLYSLLASRRVGSLGHVHAFEPAPAQFRHLEINARINGASNVILNNCAVSDSCAERDLFLSDGWNQGTHSFGAGPGRSVSCRVPCLTLDRYVEQRAVSRLDVIKVDVEGAEMLVFRGAEKTICSLSPRLIVFEAAEQHCQALGYSTSDLKRFLEEHGYAVYRLSAVSTPVGTSSKLPESYANLVALHTNAEGWYREALGVSTGSGKA